MDFFTIIGLIAACAIGAFTLQEVNKPAAVQLSIAGGAVVLLALLAQISGITDELMKLAANGGIESGVITLMLKAVGIAYLAQIASELCKDMGENALAVKSEIAGRIMLLTLAMPLITQIMDMLIDLVKLTLG